MNFKIIDQINQTHLRHDLPLFRAGDKLRLYIASAKGKKNACKTLKELLLNCKVQWLVVRWQCEK